MSDSDAESERAILQCLHCDAAMTYEEVESLESEYVAHSYPDDDGVGQVTDYYCDPICFVGDHNDR